MPNNTEEEVLDVIIEGELPDDDDDYDDDDDRGGETQNGKPGDGANETSHEDDDESEVGSKPTDSDDDSDREAIRERRRLERHERKQRAREREDSLRRELSSRDNELSQLRSRLDAIERRNTGGELAQIGNAKKKAVEAYEYFKDQIRVGTEAQNGQAVAEATEKLLQTRTRIEQLDNIEKAYVQRKQQPQPLDQRVAANAKSWVDSNKWYDPQGKDQDSRVVLMLDQTLAEEGFNPATQEYWDELSQRVKKYLPHRVTRVANRDTITTKQKTVVAGSGRETSSSGSTTFRLSAERVKALKDAGKWDDPVERNRMIKQYRDYDRNNANGGAR